MSSRIGVNYQDGIQKKTPVPLLQPICVSCVNKYVQIVLLKMKEVVVYQGESQIFTPYSLPFFETLQKSQKY
jgi:hypothetical protein